MPKVSIIVPCYNHKKYLNKRLQSIFNQTYKDYEVILLDDASTDGSAEIIKQYNNHPKVSKVIINKKNSGSPFKQWKKGINFAKGKYIWIAESDDYADKSFLKELITHLEESKSDIIFSASYNIDENNNVIGLSKFNNNKESFIVLNGNELICNHFLSSNIIPNASAVVFVKKKEIQNFLNKVLTYKINGDWLFWIYMSLNSKVIYIDKPLNYFRFHTNTARNNNTITGNNLIEYFKLLNDLYINNIADKKKIKDKATNIIFNIRKIKKQKLFNKKSYSELKKLALFNYLLLLKVLKREIREKFIFYKNKIII